jgi:hypothetical protein
MAQIFEDIINIEREQGQVANVKITPFTNKSQAEREVMARREKLKQEQKCYHCKNKDSLTTHRDTAKEAQTKLYLIPFPNKPVRKIPK